MDWLALLYDILQICVIPLLGVLTTCLIKYLTTKEKEITNDLKDKTSAKCVSMLFETIRDCVSATTQTYVEALKKDNCFTAEAQKIAFQKTFDSVMAVLTEDAKEYLTTLYGDLETYITARIEAEVKAQK